MNGDQPSQYFHPSLNIYLFPCEVHVYHLGLIHGSQKTNPKVFSDPLTFHVVPPWLTFLAISEISLQLLDGLDEVWYKCNIFPD